MGATGTVAVAHPDLRIQPCREVNTGGRSDANPNLGRLCAQMFDCQVSVCSAFWRDQVSGVRKPDLEVLATSPFCRDKFTLRRLSSLRKTVTASNVGPRLSKPPGPFKQGLER